MGGEVVKSGSRDKKGGRAVGVAGGRDSDGGVVCCSG